MRGTSTEPAREVERSVQETRDYAREVRPGHEPVLRPVKRLSDCEEFANAGAPVDALSHRPPVTPLLPPRVRSPGRAGGQTRTSADPSFARQPRVIGRPSCRLCLAMAAPLS